MKWLSPLSYYMAHIKTYPEELPPVEELNYLIDRWLKAKSDRNWEIADRLRTELSNYGIEVEEIIRFFKLHKLGPFKQIGV